MMSNLDLVKPDGFSFNGTSFDFLNRSLGRMKKLHYRPNLASFYVSSLPNMKESYGKRFMYGLARLINIRFSTNSSFTLMQAEDFNLSCLASSVLVFTGLMFLPGIVYLDLYDYYVIDVKLKEVLHHLFV